MRRLHSAFDAAVGLQEEVLIVRRRHKLIDACAGQCISISPLITLLSRQDVESCVVTLGDDDGREPDGLRSHLQRGPGFGVGSINGGKL